MAVTSSFWKCECGSKTRVKHVVHNPDGSIRRQHACNAKCGRKDVYTLQKVVLVPTRGKHERRKCA